jgi:small GTP-binding protein
MHKSLFKLSVLCDAGAGTTQVLNRLTRDQFDSQYRTSVGCDFYAKEFLMKDQTSKTAQMWEIPATEYATSAGASCMNGSDGLVLVFDITNAESFKNLGTHYEHFFAAGTYNEKENVPVVILGNKVDKASDRKVSQEQVKQWASAYNIPIENYFETSAKDNINLNEAFTALLELANQNAIAKAEKAKVEESLKISEETKQTEQIQSTNDENQDVQRLQEEIKRMRSENEKLKEGSSTLETKMDNILQRLEAVEKNFKFSTKFLSNLGKYAEEISEGLEEDA